jgi:predicted lipase
MASLDALTFAELSTAIYFSLDLSRFTTGNLESEVKVFDLDTELGYLRVPGNKIVFVYKGSCSLIDWAYNFKFGKMRFKSNLGSDIKVHKGIYLKFLTTIEWMQSKITEKDSIYITGHSLGGALSMVAGLTLVDLGYGDSIKEIYTFGSPKVGNSGWQKCYNEHLSSKTHRYVNKGDWIPYLPPSLFGFRSTSGIKCLDTGKGFINHHLPWMYVTALREEANRLNGKKVLR